MDVHYTILTDIMKLMDIPTNSKMKAEVKRELIAEKLSEINDETLLEIEEIIKIKEDKLRERGVLCFNKGCKKIPIFNYEGIKNGLYCTNHKEIGMINIRRNNCQFNGCKKRSCYNYKECKNGLLCYIHKEIGMINVVDKTCEFDGCIKRPIYNYEGLRTAIFCALHKKVGMVNIISNVCQFNFCKKQPYYNYKGINKGLYCTLHKEIGMVDIKNVLCQFNGCKKKPSYNYKGIKKGIYCNIHKKVGMIISKNNFCQFNGCEKVPYFNYKGIKKGLYCNFHKETGMINIKSNTCYFTDCETLASYGITGNKPESCAKHRKVGMVKYPTKRCKELYCNELATHAEQGCIVSMCETHAPDDYINIYEQECKNCSLKYVLNKKGFCENCDPETFKRAYLAKQNEVEDYLRKNAPEFFQPEYKPQVDKMVNKGECAKQRPDFMFDLGDKILIVEVDENQHNAHSYLSSSPMEKKINCEAVRMFNITQTLGGMPVIFLRYNPDKCINSKGIINTTTRKQRMDELIFIMRSYAKKQAKDIFPDGEILTWVMYLYYNDDDKAKRELKPIILSSTL